MAAEWRLLMLFTLLATQDEVSQKTAEGQQDDGSADAQQVENVFTPFRVVTETELQRFADRYSDPILARLYQRHRQVERDETLAA